jgi:hypothetical protein
MDNLLPKTKAVQQIPQQSAAEILEFFVHLDKLSLESVLDGGQMYEFVVQHLHYLMTMHKLHGHLQLQEQRFLRTVTPMELWLVSIQEPEPGPMR